MIAAAWSERVVCCVHECVCVCVCVCVLGGMGELVQWRNPIGLSDNTQGRGVGGSYNTAYSLGRRKGRTLNLTDTHMIHKNASSPETSLSLPLHGSIWCEQFIRARIEGVHTACTFFKRHDKIFFWCRYLCNLHKHTVQNPLGERAASHNNITTSIQSKSQCFKRAKCLTLTLVHDWSSQSHSPDLFGKLSGF